mgnify:FL=1
MWTSNRKREGLSQECAADQGIVTLGGDPAAVYLGGERRWVSLYTPGGYQWRPKAGDKVLVVKAGDHREIPCLVGKRPDELSEEDELPPGSVRIHSGTGVVLLDEEGLTLQGDEVALEGDITVNGQSLQSYIQNIVYQVLASIMG